MANPLGLLLIGILGCWGIGRINHSSKVFFACLVAMLLGFASGATISKLIPLEKVGTTIVMVDNTEKGETTSMLRVMEPSIVMKPVTCYSSVIGKEMFRVDNLYSITSGVMTVHPVRCLSPPSYQFSMRRDMNFINDSS